MNLYPLLANRVQVALWLAACLVYLGLSPSSSAAAQELTFSQAYRETLAWASGIQDTNILDSLYERIERSSYRYNILPEFALAVVASEARYGSKISWARYESWTMYEVTVGQKLAKYPSVLDDLDTALSELRLVMSDENVATMDQVLFEYWSGPNQEFNKDTLPAFREAVSKLWNGLEPFARQRKISEDQSKYDPEYWEQRDSSSWASLANGDLEGYRSAIGSMPTLAEQLVSFPEEAQYAAAIKSINRSLTDSEAIVIARAILTYCAQTDWEVDPRFVMSIVRAESAFKPKAVSKVGALGLGQLMPATAKSFGIRDAFDPIQNLYGCVKYLERELYRWRGRPDRLNLVMASYNAGAGAVQKYNGVPPYRETQNFVVTVNKYYREFCSGD